MTALGGNALSWKTSLTSVGSSNLPAETRQNEKFSRKLYEPVKLSVSGELVPRW